MSRELLSIENGRILENGGTVWNGLYLQIYSNEIAGIICDDIQAQKCLIDFLLGKLELESGRIFLEEKRIPNSGITKVLSDRVALIDKKSKLIETITIEDNIFLFSDRSFWVEKKQYEARFFALQEKLGIRLPSRRKLSELSTKERVLVELMKAYVEDKKVVILSDLSEYLQKPEVEELFSLLLHLQNFGMTFLIRIGFEDEYMQQIKRVTVLKDRKTVAILNTAEENVQTVARRLFFDENAVKMNLKRDRVSVRFQQEPILSFHNVSTSYLHGINFSLMRGALLKIHCFDDQSSEQVIGLLKGETKLLSGKILYRKRRYRANHIVSAVRQGICFIEESAYDRMLFQNMSILENLSIPCDEKVKRFWFFSRYSESIAKNMGKRLGKKALKQQVKNQTSSLRQQVVYYKWLLYYPKVVVCVNPFSNVDIYMREKAIDMIRLYLERGISVIIITSNYYTVDKFEGETIRISKGKQIEEF